MRGFATLALATAAVLCLSIPSHGHGQGVHAALTGLWQGVDNVDGSLRTVPIADLDSDGVFEIRATIPIGPCARARAGSNS